MAQRPKTQCFAFNLDGVRCTKSGGHQGDHAAAIEWGDDDCHNPMFGQLQQAKPFNYPAPYLLGEDGSSVLGLDDYEQITEEVMLESGNVLRPSRATTEHSAACIACRHSHPSGTCRCGCYAHIG